MKTHVINNEDRVDYLTRFNSVAKTCGDNDKLYARYGYKFMYDLEETDPKIVFEELKKKPLFRTKFQEIYTNGLIAHFFGEDFLPWMNSDKLEYDWFYAGDLTDKKFYKTFDELKTRGIYV